MTPSQIIQLPNIIYNIVTFTDIPATLNFAETNKKIYKIINHDNRFIFIKVIYIIYKSFNQLTFDIWLNLILTDRYNYYKIIPSQIILFNGDYYNDTEAKDYYRNIQNDRIIVYPKYFNESYSDVYYGKKMEYELITAINWYELGLDKLIEYHKIISKPYILIDGAELRLPLKSLAKFDIEFAKKLRILITNREEYCSELLRFKYNDIIGIFDNIYTFHGAIMQLKINKKHFRCNIFDDDKITGLKKHLIEQMAMSDIDAELFARFLKNMFIINIEHQLNYSAMDF